MSCGAPSILRVACRVPRFREPRDSPPPGEGPGLAVPRRLSFSHWRSLWREPWLTSPRASLTRRSFLNVLLGIGVVGWAGSIFYPILEYFKIPPRKDDEPDSVVAAKFSELKPNAGVIFKFGSEPALLLMSPDGQLRAFSAVCTHLDCTVRYRSDLQKIHCACHNGIYDLNGQNISGPPPRPLRQYKVAQSGDDVVVSRA